MKLDKVVEQVMGFIKSSISVVKRGKCENIYEKDFIAFTSKSKRRDMSSFKTIQVPRKVFKKIPDSLLL